MAISVQDLDALLGYDPENHTVAGMPTLAPKAGSATAAAPTAAMPVLSPKTQHPLQSGDVALDVAQSGMTTAHPKMPTVAAPVAAPVAAAAPVAPEISAGAAPDTVGGTMPSIARPNIHGKAAYEAGMPTVTAEPGTEAYGKQRQEVLDYKKAHPWGSEDSEHPGTWGKIAHGLAVAGNIAGDIFAPGTMANIPGTQMNERVQEKENNKLIEEGAQNDIRKTASEAVPWVDQKTGAVTMLPRKEWATLEAAAEKAGATTGAAETRADAAREIAAGHDTTASTIAAGKSKDQLLKMGYDEHGEPLPDDKLSKQQIAARDLTSAHTKLQQAQAAVDAAKADPNSPASKAAAASLALRQAEFQNKLQEQGLVKPSGQTVSRGNAADAALQLLPGLEDAIKANGSKMGPTMGRIAKGEIKIGDVDPETQKLYSQLESFYALQPSVHGFRNAEFVKDFDTFIGNLQTNPEAVIAGLEGLKPTLEAVKKSGLTYQQRIVEPPAGGGAAPAAAAAGGLPVGWK